MWIDQLSLIVGEISVFAAFGFSCAFFLPLAQELLDTIEVIAMWTIIGAILTNAALSALTSVYTLVGIYREYRKQALLGNFIKITPTYNDQPTAFRAGLALD